MSPVPSLTLRVLFGGIVMGTKQAETRKEVRKGRKYWYGPSYMQRLMVLHRVVTQGESFVVVALDLGKDLADVIKWVTCKRAMPAKRLFRKALEAERRVREEFNAVNQGGVEKEMRVEAKAAAGEEVKALPAAREETEEELARIVARRQKEMES
jgi:hypothetical protein